MNVDDYNKLIEDFEVSKRRTFTSMVPILKRPIGFCRIKINTLFSNARYKIARGKSEEFFTNVTARHQSTLRRKLGTSDSRLQDKKIINLKRACKDLNGLIVYPGEVFSMWDVLGEPTKARGYVDGMLLSNGKVIEGVGGGLCQLSNFLCWILLHANTEVVERSHHSFDAFPDSGRTLPFGSGATCLYNQLDLKFKNVGKHPIQIKIWITDKYLKGQIVSPERNEIKFSIKEKDHKFIKNGETYFRYNEIWRIQKKKGIEIDREKIFVNFAPVMYEIPEDYFERNLYSVLHLK